jgi:hypothetical protein
MGNKSSTTLSNLHDAIATDKVSITNIRGDETLQYLDTFLEFAESISSLSVSKGEVTLASMTAKDFKTLVSVASLLCAELGKEAPQISSPSVFRACRMKALATLFWLLSVPQVSKGSMESCISPFTVCMDYMDIDQEYLVLSCILVGLKAVEDDAFRVQTCLQLGKGGFYGKLIGYLEEARQSDCAETSLFLFTVAVEHLLWCLQGENLTLNSSDTEEFSRFQQTVVRAILNRRDALFDLTRHPNIQVCYCATLLLIRVLSLQDKKICHLFQVMSLQSMRHSVYLTLDVLFSLSLKIQVS